MSRIAVSIGFFLPMLATVAVDHLLKQPRAAEVLDAVVTTAFFTAVFSIGVRLGRSPARTWSPLEALLRGLAAGLIVQVVLWGLWLSVPATVRYSFGLWPLLGHVLLIATVGYMLARVRGGDPATP